MSPGAPRASQTSFKETTNGPNSLPASPAVKHVQPAHPKPSVKPSPVKQPAKSVPTFKTPIKQGGPKKKPITPVKKAAKSTAGKTTQEKPTAPVNNTTTAVKPVTPVKTAVKPTPVKNRPGVKTAGSAAAKPKPANSFAVKTVSQINNVPTESPKASAKNVTQITTTTKTPATVTKTTNAVSQVTTASKPSEKVAPAAKSAAKVTTATEANLATKTPAQNNTPVGKSTPEKVDKTDEKATPAVKTTEQTNPAVKTSASETDVKQEEKLDQSKNETKEDTKETKASASEENIEPLREITPEISQVMAEELAQIMIKIWQTLPDEGTTPAERVAVKVFRGDAGDDLRDVLELNLKQRLLNIHNQFKMRVALDKDLPKKWMSQFVRKFSVKRVKAAAVGDSKRHFVVELANFQDFDKLYAANRTKMGGVKVTLSPVYNFTEEPEKLLKIEHQKLQLAMSKIDSGNLESNLSDECMDAELDFASLMKEGIVLDECEGSDDEE